MAIKIADNLNYAGQKPDFVRQQYSTYEEMKAVKDAFMPPMYIAYCLEDEKIYLYNKNNEIDETLGKFREFTPGGGSDTQVTEMPEATAATVGTILQYIGETDGNYTKGYFYIGNQTPHSEDVPIETLEQLTDVIGRSDGVVPLITGTEQESVQALLKDSDAYFIRNDIIYHGVVSEGVVVFINCTAITTDEEVATLGIVEEVSVTTLARLDELIAESTDSVTLRIDSETTEIVTAIVDGEKAYFVRSDITYKGDIVSDEVAFDDCTAIETDEDVVALDLVETVTVSTLERLTELIEASDGIISLTVYVTESVQALLKESTAYFIKDEIIYYGTIVGTSVVFADCTTVETDEDVVALNITETVTTYTYGWENVSVSPSGGEPATITTEDINALFD